MKTSTFFICGLTMLATAAVAGDAAYTGKWKLNPAKSDFGESAVLYEQAADGSIRITDEGKTFTIKTDGKEYPTPWGMTTSWKNAGPNTWERTNRANGKVTSTAVVRISPDDKTLTIDSKGTLASGETFNDVVTFERVSGKSGLAGKWKMQKVKMDGPQTMMIEPQGSDGVRITMVEDKGQCAAKLDGKDYPASGPLWPSGWTCAITQHTANGLQMAWKKDGKPMYEDSLTVAEGGRVLNDVSTAVGTNEKVKMVYERQ
jgi:hypothetical protein